jgi:carbon monoxide dehydrogenase subunit G
VLIENAFTVNAPADDLWSFLLDVERIAPCMPGAELTEVIDERNWKGKVHMKFGPVAVSFAGTVSMDSRNDEHTVSCCARRGRNKRARARRTRR